MKTSIDTKRLNFNECKQNQSSQTNDCVIGNLSKNEMNGHLICNYVGKWKSKNLRNTKKENFAMIKCNRNPASIMIFLGLQKVRKTHK